MKFETRLRAAFVAAVLVLALLLFGTIKIAHEDDAAAQAVLHTHETLTDIRRVRSGVLLLETLTRGYVISGDASVLPQRLEAMAELEAALQRLQALTSDDAGQRQRWQRLRELTELRVATANQLVQLRQSAGFEAAQAYFLSAPVEEIRVRILAKLSEMTAAERDQLAQRQAAHQSLRPAILAFDVLLALALATLLAGTYAFIRRQLRAIEASRRALTESEQSLSTTLHSIGDAVLATDSTGRITRMNAVAERLTGWPMAEALGRPVEEVFRIHNEQTRAPAEIPVAQVLATGELKGLTNHAVLIARDGREWPIADSAAPIRTTEGQVSGVVLVFRDVTAERQAELTIREINEQLEQRVQERTAQLHESEERLRLLVDGARDYAIIMLDPQGRVLTWNEGARRLKGYAEAEILGQSLRLFYPPEDVACGKPERLLEQALREDRCEDEGWHLRQDGTRFYANVLLSPIHDAAGALVGYAKITRDITERWRAQRQQEAEQSVLEGISTGRPLDEVLGLIAQHVEALAPQTLCSILLLDADGLHLGCAVAPSLPDAYNRAIDGLPIGPQAGSCGTAAYRNEQVIVTDIGTDPLWADYAALALPLGLRACWSTPVRSGSGAVLGTFALYYREPRTPAPAELQLIERWTRITSIAIEHRQHQEDLRQLNIDLERRVLERTAELERARLEAERLTRVKDTFLATMSHEIRTPMNALLGMLELMGLYRLEPEQARRIDVAQSAGKSLLRIIDDILDFSRIEAGQLEIRPEPASLAELVELTANFFLPVASSKGLLLSHSVDPRIGPALRVDRLRLRQILNNFVSNAIKFTERGEVRIEAELIERRPQADWVRLSVSDTGVGIATEVQARLFQPFSQADAETTRRYGGSGLGLAICQRLTEMMDGQIELHSVPGQGTTLNLSLELPRIELAELQAAQAAGRALQAPGAAGLPGSALGQTPSALEARAAGTLVLLVDDHPTNREVLSEQLHALGYASEQAASSAEALRMWEMAHYGLLITDCHMPDMDGYQLARTIRRQEAETGRARTPILAWTANVLGKVADLCAEAGMDDVLVKPAHIGALRAKIERLLVAKAAQEPTQAPAPAAAASPPWVQPAPAATAQLAQPQPEQPEPEVLQRAILRELTGGDADMERRILLRFRASNRIDADALAQAVAAHEAQAVAHYAHRIKGAARLIGAQEFASACEALEQAAKNADWEVIEAAQTGFARSFVRLERVLPC